MKVNKISENIYEIPKEGKMLVPGIIYASEELMDKIKLDKTLEQVKNVAQLPGIVGKSIALSDAHQGYGFSIGGVAAFDLEKGIISPGGVGYDINCGVRLLITNIKKIDFMFKRNAIINEIYKLVPSGVGEGTKDKLSMSELDKVLNQGVQWAVEKRYATSEDAERTEDNGCIQGADASKVSQRAKSRGKDQLGTLGSGNHFLEIQEVEKIIDEKIASAFGIDKDNICIMIHTGSRGLGHQVASDYIQSMERMYGIKNLPDRELINAPINSKIGQDYFAAMNAAANFAFVNRQLITHQVRQAFKRFFPKGKLTLLYDVAHNIAKFEEFTIDGKKKTLCVHRKGATRSFGPGRKELPKEYQKTGQPIILPGSMGTFSYILVGTKSAENISFASTAHGAGRVLSRSYATSHLNTDKLSAEMKSKDIVLKAGSMKGALEEAPEAYKDINEVARVSDALGIGSLVARMKPLAVIKG
jgi:tRNA-splicing ligase RtcB